MNKLKGRSVTVVDGNVEKALRKFKKKVQESNILNEVKDRAHYTKPTTQRKIKRSAARNRWQRYLADQALPKKMY